MTRLPRSTAGAAHTEKTMTKKILMGVVFGALIAATGCHRNTRENMEHKAERAGDKIEDTADTAKDKAKDAAETAGDKIEDATDK